MEYLIGLLVGVGVGGWIQTWLLKRFGFLRTPEQRYLLGFCKCCPAAGDDFHGCDCRCHELAEMKAILESMEWTPKEGGV